MVGRDLYVFSDHLSFSLPRVLIFMHGALSWIRGIQVPEEHTNAQRDVWLFCWGTSQEQQPVHSIISGQHRSSSKQGVRLGDAAWGVLWGLTQTQGQKHLPTDHTEHTDTLSRNGFGAKTQHTTGEHPLEVRWMNHLVRGLKWESRHVSTSQKLQDTLKSRGCCLVYFLDAVILYVWIPTCVSNGEKTT